MGKPFAGELDKLDSTYIWARDVPLNDLPMFVRNSKNRFLLTVGSGGSLTAAALASLLHQESGTISQYMTPLEMVTSNCSLRDSSTLLITARGRNYDAIQSFRSLAQREPRHLMVLCASTPTPLGKIVKAGSFAQISEFSLPAGKDGFLAVNSLMAFVVILTRSYEAVMGEHYNLPASLVSLVGPKSKRGPDYSAVLNTGSLTDGKTLFVLYGKWGKPAALDLESKFSEAALGNVTLADYRNFAHGRHNWLAKRGRDTVLIALATPEDEQLANKTIGLIPSTLPVVRVSSEHQGPAGAIDLIVQIMYLVYAMGQKLKIDPGRPGIPRFGERIYHLRLHSYSNIGLRRLGRDEYPAIWRKVNAAPQMLGAKNSVDFWLDAFHQFVKNLSTARFCGLVLDYDGTICDPKHRSDPLQANIVSELCRILGNDIIVGVATGRGKSVRNSLKEAIPRDRWNQVIIGYYNGSDIGVLSDTQHPNKSNPLDSKLKSLVSRFAEEHYDNEVKIECRPKQVTFEPTGSESLQDVFSIVNELARRDEFEGLNAVESSHSIDLLAPEVSKLRLTEVVETKARELEEKASILCVGDKGAWPGNDYALLSRPFSLSVDTVSRDPFSCWNLAPLGCRGEQVALQYLRALEREGKSLKFSLRRWRSQRER